MKEFIVNNVVRFSDSDLYGVVHHSNYYKLIEEARFEYLEKILNISMESLEKDNLKFPVISLNGKYIIPIKARENIRIAININYDDTSKIIFQYKIYNENNRLTFVGSTEHVAVKNNKMLFKLPDYINKILMDLNSH